MSKPATGRPSLFRGKDSAAQPLQGRVTAKGRAAFERSRVKLARLGTKYRVEGKPWTAAEVSDGDTFEYLALGHEKVEALFRLDRVARNIAKNIAKA